MGLLVLVTYVVEAAGWALSAGIVRAVMATAYVVQEVPLSFAKGRVGTLGRVVQIAVALLLLGLVLPAAAPAYRLGLLHVLFIGGFNLLTLAVANWVIFGHSGAGHRSRKPLVVIRIGAGLILFALATRISAEFLPDVRQSHLVYAALAWILGTLVWAWKVLPRVRLTD